MVSSTRYIEVVRVDRTAPVQIECGCNSTPADGAYEIVGNTGSTSPTWFEDQAKFHPGTYRIQYLGSTRNGGSPIQPVPKLCVGCSDYSWKIPITSEPSNTVTPANLTNWIPVVYVDDQVNARWNVGNPANTVTQTENDAPAFFVSPNTYNEPVFTVKVGVYDADGDDDFIGVAFAIKMNGSIPNDYYLLSWKKVAQSNYGVWAEKGFKLLRVTGISGQITATMRRLLWDCDNWTNNAGARIQVLASNNAVGWEMSVNYNVTVRYQNNGQISINVSRESDNNLIWQTTITDPAPLPDGRVALYCHSQAQTRFTTYMSSGAQHLIEGPAGTMCTAGSRGMKFNGSSDDIVAIIHADSHYSVNAQSINGPVTFTIPDDHIIFNQTGGHILGSRDVAYAPFTSQKTIKTSTLTHTYPEGTFANVRQGQVSDMISSGFNIKSWGEEIPISEFSRLKWVDKDGTVRFKMIFIPCGTGYVDLKSISCVQGTSNPSDPTEITPTTPTGPSTSIWKIVAGGANIIVDNAPTTIGTSVTFPLPDERTIGVRFDQTKAGITSPIFRLVPVTYTILNPRQIEFAATNNTIKKVVYHFVVSDGDASIDSRYGPDLKYFSVNGKMFSPDGLDLAPKSHINVKCNWPFNTTASQLMVDVYSDNTLIDSIDLDMESRAYVEQGLHVTRDLVDPYQIQNVRSIMWGKNINPNNYTPYIYASGQITVVGLTETLALGTVLVCVHNDARNEPEVLNAIKNNLRILPNRHV